MISLHRFSITYFLHRSLVRKRSISSYQRPKAGIEMILSFLFYISNHNLQYPTLTDLEDKVKPRVRRLTSPKHIPSVQCGEDEELQ
jgi:hypothetical protein